MSTIADVIIIGGGPAGLATAFHLGRRGASTLLLEQHDFINQAGSSAGVTRQFRIPYPDEYMVKLAVAAQPFWDELQNTTSLPLLDKVGTLWFGDPAVRSTEGNIGAAEKSLTAAGVPYTTLSADDIQRDYPFTDLPDTYVGLFQPDGASINLRATQQALLDANAANPNVTLRPRSPVLEIAESDGVFKVRTPDGVCVGRKLVITPGPYVDSVINLLGFQISATYWNMSSAYFRILDPTLTLPTWFVFQNPVGDNGNQFYGFPAVDWDYPGYIRVAPDFVMSVLEDPAKRSAQPNPQELAFTSAWVSDHMRGLDPTPAFTSTCLVALSTLPDKQMLLDFAPGFVPRSKDVVVFATGWAAKFTPLIGRILADLTLDGSTSFDIAPFQLGDNFFSAL